MSTGEGEGREGEDRCTVFKRNVETKYKLKKDTSRALFNEVNAKAGTMAFTTRMISEERTAKAGIIECRAHNLFSAYPVFNEARLCLKPWWLVAMIPPPSVAQVAAN